MDKFLKENRLCRKINLLSKKLMSVSVTILPSKIVLTRKKIPMDLTLQNKK